MATAAGCTCRQSPLYSKHFAVVESAAKRWQATKPGTLGYEVSVARLRYLADMHQFDELPPSAFWPTPPRAPDLVRLDRLD